MCLLLRTLNVGFGENRVVIKKKQIADILNSFFLNVVDGTTPLIEQQHYGQNFNRHPSIKAILENNCLINNKLNNFSFQSTNKREVVELLKKINTQKSCGYDGISPRLLKESSTVISGPLSAIMTQSLREDHFPTRWKMGQVTSLFKKDDESKKDNYRPVTVLPALNIIFERLLSFQLENLYHKVLSDFISAYRRHYSCKTSLLRLTEEVVFTKRRLWP